MYPDRHVTMLSAFRQDSLLTLEDSGARKLNIIVLRSQLLVAKL